jgi:predicted ester cyclase
MKGKEQVEAFLGGLFQGLSDFHSTQTRILVSGNIMVPEAVSTGTHLGELSGIPATGNSLRLPPLHIWEFEGDKVAIRWTVNGTHLGELMGVPSTGRPVEFTGATIYRFAYGKIVENWWAYDALGMMQQITAPPETEPPPG